MEHVSAVAAETKASSLVRLFKNHSKILKLLQLKILAHILILEVFEKKIRHRIHYIFDNVSKKRFKNFRSIGYRYWLWVHERSIYWYQPHKSHIGQSLLQMSLEKV